MDKETIVAYLESEIDSLNKEWASCANEGDETYHAHARGRYAAWKNVLNWVNTH